MKRLAVLILVAAATAVNAFWNFNHFRSYESRDLMDDIEFIMEKNEKPNCVTCGKIEKCRWHTIKLTKEEEIELLKEYIRENYIGCIGLNPYDDGTYESRRFVDIVKRLELLTGNRYIHEELRDEVEKECKKLERLYEKIYERNGLITTDYFKRLSKEKQEALKKSFEVGCEGLHHRKLIKECRKRCFNE